MIRKNYTIEVYSRAGMQDYISKEHSNKAILISLRNEEDKPLDATTCRSICSTLHLVFDDIDRVREGLKAMDMQDGEAIYNFISKCQEQFNFDTILVNCGAGQSRSAGVAAALMKFFNNDDSAIFNNPRYTPNMRCYRIVLNQMEELQYQNS